MTEIAYKCLHVLIYLEIICVIYCHVCSKQKLQTYSTNVDRAFICPERYTTSCGQLDWRRCTKYRVSTCYSPTQKYATRYATVEVCCPGWRGDTCSEPICPESCQHGGVCSDLGGHPGCRCIEGYYGDTCQYARNKSNALEIVLACCAGLVTIGVIVIAIVMYRRRNVRLSQVAPITIPVDVPGHGGPQQFEQRTVPSAPRFNT